MKNILKLGTVAAATVALASSIQATPIQGSIGFSGGFTQDGTSGDLTTATQFAITSPAIVTSPAPTGAFVGATLVSFATPIGVNGSLGNLVGNNLWQVQVGTTTYNLLVSTETQTFLSSSQLNITGTGTLGDGTAADDTLGDWQISFGVSGGGATASFGFQATSANHVPDGGATAMLLGLGITGLALIRRKA